MRTLVTDEQREERRGKDDVVKAHLAVLFTNIFFAGNYSLIKFISPSHIGPYALNVVRVGICVLLFWLVWMFGKSTARIERKDWGRFFICALTGITLNQILFIKGLTLTTTIHAALLILVTPVVVSIFALWVLNEFFSIYKALGLALGIGGAVFLIMQREGGQQAENYLLGDILIILNAISYSIYFILVKPLMQHYSALHVIRWIFTIGFFMLLPVGWVQVSETDWTLFGWEQISALLYVSIFGTFIAYYFNIFGIKKLGASITGSYIYTQPVFAVVIAVMFVNEEITWQKIVSALLIFAGVYLVNLKRK